MAAGPQASARRCVRGPESTTILSIPLRGRRQAECSRYTMKNYQGLLLPGSNRTTFPREIMCHSLLNQSPNSLSCDLLCTQHSLFSILQAHRINSLRVVSQASYSTRLQRTWSGRLFYPTAWDPAGHAEGPRLRPAGTSHIAIHSWGISIRCSLSAGSTSTGQSILGWMNSRMQRVNCTMQGIWASGDLGIRGSWCQSP